MPDNHNNYPWILFIFGLWFFITGNLFSVGSYFVYERDLKIEKTGIRTTAIITNREFLRDDSPDGSSDYLITYQFKTKEGQVVEKLRGVHKDYWNNVQRGMSIDVVYDEKDPKLGFPIGQGMTSFVFSLCFGLFGLIFMIPGFIWLAYGARQISARFRGK